MKATYAREIIGERHEKPNAGEVEESDGAHHDQPEREKHGQHENEQPREAFGSKEETGTMMKK